MVGNRLEVCLLNVQKRLRSKQIKSGIEMNFYREAQNHRFPISKQDKGVRHCPQFTATGNAVREL
jgi:hypothetical protein